MCLPWPRLSAVRKGRAALGVLGLLWVECRGFFLQLPLFLGLPLLASLLNGMCVGGDINFLIIEKSMGGGACWHEISEVLRLHVSHALYPEQSISFMTFLLFV